MQYVYTNDVLQWWVTNVATALLAFMFHIESVNMLQLARSVLYVPPTETLAETAFSIQKWMLSSRRSTMTPTNCNIRMVGRSCKRLKRRIEQVKAEMRAKKKVKVEVV